MLGNQLFIEKVQHIFRDEHYNGKAFLCYMDFANFKMINRYYGIKCGNDFLLKAETYLSTIPYVVSYERLYADMFAFIIITNKEYSNKQIVKAYEKYAKKFIDEQASIYQACNFKTYCGIYPIKYGNVHEAMDFAGIAWRKAKDQKILNAVMFDSTMRKELIEQQNTVAEVNLALREERFIFYLQPQVDLKNEQIIGSEALVRRMAKDGTIIYPDKFLKVMEEDGSVMELDFLVTKKVCEYLAKRIEEKKPVVKTAINLSRIHLLTDDTAEKLHKIATSYQIPSNLLEFELTETILMDDFDSARNLCDSLRNYGYSMAIDDFGSGYAGIGILQELDFDQLKLDKKFLSKEKSLRDKNKVLIPDILHSLKLLKIDSICEGIEEKEQCEYLKKVGCDKGQGYYFSRPIPADQFYEQYENRI